MFVGQEVIKYNASSVLAWTGDVLFQSDNVGNRLLKFSSAYEPSRWLLRCAIYHWLVSNNKLAMALEREGLDQFIVSAIGAELLPLLRELKPIRAMWEHDFNHLDGGGHYQAKFVRPLDLRQAGLAEDQMIAATQLVLNAGKLMIGGRLDFEIMASAVRSFAERLGVER